MPTLDVLVAGNKCVGKSSLVYCFISGKVLQPPFDGIFLYALDHGLPYMKINVESQNFQLRIRECTLVEEKPFKDEIKACELLAYKADVLIFMLAVDGPFLHSFKEDRIKNSITALAKRYLKPTAPIFLVKNKTDIENQKVIKDVSTVSNPITFTPSITISPTVGDTLARKINAVKYLECSCVTGMGVQNLFYEAVWATLQPCAAADIST